MNRRLAGRIESLFIDRGELVERTRGPRIWHLGRPVLRQQRGGALSRANKGGNAHAQTTNSSVGPIESR